MRSQWTIPAAVLTAAALTGCGLSPGSKPTSAASARTTPVTAATTAAVDTGADADVAAERAKLSPEDKALVEAQEWCVISSDERLGSMGPPVKLDVKGQPVFVCCGGCKKKALADPDKTLAKAEALKAKKVGGGV